MFHVQQYPPPARPPRCSTWNIPSNRGHRRIVPRGTLPKRGTIAVQIPFCPPRDTRPSKRRVPRGTTTLTERGHMWTTPSAPPPADRSRYASPALCVPHSPSPPPKRPGQCARRGTNAPWTNGGELRPPMRVRRRGCSTWNIPCRRPASLRRTPCRCQSVALVAIIPTIRSSSSRLA